MKRTPRSTSAPTPFQVRKCGSSVSGFGGSHGGGATVSRGTKWRVVYAGAVGVAVAVTVSARGRGRHGRRRGGARRRSRRRPEQQHRGQHRPEARDLPIARPPVGPCHERQSRGRRDVYRNPVNVPAGSCLSIGGGTGGTERGTPSRGIDRPARAPACARGPTRVAPTRPSHRSSPPSTPGWSARCTSWCTTTDMPRRSPRTRSSSCSTTGRRSWTTSSRARGCAEWRSGWRCARSVANGCGHSSSDVPSPSWRPSWSSPVSRAEVFAAVRALPTNQRVAVVLHYFEDRPVAEIADALGCAEATARVHLFKARQRLASLLRREGGRRCRWMTGSARTCARSLPTSTRRSRRLSARCSQHGTVVRGRVTCCSACSPRPLAWRSWADC